MIFKKCLDEKKKKKNQAFTERTEKQEWQW